jgi:hypothetical protein
MPEKNTSKSGNVLAIAPTIAALRPIFSPAILSPIAAPISICVNESNV